MVKLINEDTRAECVNRGSLQLLAEFDSERYCWFISDFKS